MSIYRRKYRSADGRQCRARFFTAEFTYRGRVYRQGGFVDRDSARHWLESESKRIRRGAVGYTKPMLQARILPLIDEFAEALAAKGNDPEYTYIVKRRVIRLATECAWLTLGDMNAADVEAWQRQPHEFHGKPVGPVALNQIVQAAQQFAAWLVKPRHLLQVSPLEEVSRLKAQLNSAYRRAASPEEINKLLAKCGPDRRLFYVFLLYCPLRMNTIRHLTWRQLHLDDERPWILLPAATCKSRRDERSPIRQDVAAMLRTARKRRKAKAAELVFTPFPTIDDLREDLAAAGVTFADPAGNRRLDRHAFRKTLVRWCKRAGVALDDAALLLHHKDPRTTRKHYDDDLIDPDLTTAIERLPAIGQVRTA